MSPPKRVAIYARLSRLTDTNAANIDTQVKECRELARARGWLVVEEFREVESAYDREFADSRPGFGALLNGVGDGRFDVVMAWAFDRLYRSPEEAAVFFRLCGKHGVMPTTVREGDRDPNNPGDDMLNTMMAAIARFESAVKSSRLQAKARQIAEQGRIGGGGTRPFGFESHTADDKPDRVTHREEEAESIRWAVDQVLAGRSLRWIALNMPVGPVQAARWSPSPLRNMLLSPRIAGIREHRGVEVAKAVWQPIVQEDKWRAACRVLQDPARKTWRPAPRYLLNGIAVDAIGRRLFARPNGRGVRCYISLPDERGPGVRIEAAPTEALVDEFMTSDIVSRWHRAQSNAVETSPPPDNSERVREIDEEIEQMISDKADGRLRYPAFRSLYVPLMTERDALVAEMKPVQHSIDLDAALSEYESLEVLLRREAISAVVSKVVVRPAVRGRNTFDRSRVHIHLRSPGLSLLPGVSSSTGGERRDPDVGAEYVDLGDGWVVGGSPDFDDAPDEDVAPRRRAWR